MTKEIGIFAAGCFWGVEESFLSTQGVAETEVGYIGGTTSNPSYEDVCRGDTNHAEVVLLEFDPSIISYESLVKKFYEIHDPTTLNQQGPDKGTQYRSIVVYYDETQKQKADSITKKLNETKFQNSITTTIESLGCYQKAEDYHQQYLKKKYSFLEI